MLEMKGVRKTVKGERRERREGQRQIPMIEPAYYNNIK